MKTKFIHPDQQAAPGRRHRRQRPGAVASPFSRTSLSKPVKAKASDDFTPISTAPTWAELLGER
ncbi:hypothetical protein KQ313_02960 [Synechococcus sp. CS-1325]|uniref:hypothetical protein n=1 Tax=unclassified Synechococcus TaxID=2626047 RepID=UPI000DB12B4C|nr:MULTISPECIES: hypothetical protein [unclassified Synechococcus]MCT0198644.1 hypothetical protein [Synechococcus sp. CS-1325]MCT0212761.1 hypothetical protein [Synechococcus sp. CS-1326]MCT0232593.1 hypothetical protein [Synechococcus sp. CS-1327]PZV02111.1 MAG: hypothetical protein DCF24_02600 [Cyanobium sp.]